MRYDEQGYLVEPFTYEAFMEEPCSRRHFDVVDNVRVFTSNSFAHQDIMSNLTVALNHFERSHRQGHALFGTFDVLITKEPFQVRQPDVLFIGNERWRQYYPELETHPLRPAPELVIEILEALETLADVQDKIVDYCRVGVRECWAAHSDTDTLEQLLLSPKGAETVRVYSAGETVQSIAFSDLFVDVDAIFAE